MYNFSKENLLAIKFCLLKPVARREAYIYHNIETVFLKRNSDCIMNSQSLEKNVFDNTELTIT